VRRVGAAGVLLALVAAGCSGDPSEESAAPSSASAWQPGQAVVVLVADVKHGPEGDLGDYGQFMKRPGVIAVWSKNDTLRVSLSRKALLTDMAALRFELERTAGLSNVREVLVPPQ
jgi:hypothetical protein